MYKFVSIISVVSILLYPASLSAEDVSSRSSITHESAILDPEFQSVYRLLLQIASDYKSTGVRDRIIRRLEEFFGTEGKGIEDAFALGKSLGRVSSKHIVDLLLDYLEYHSRDFIAGSDLYPNSPQVLGNGKVEFQLYAPKGSFVQLAGDFTNWRQNPVKMHPVGDVLPDGNQRYVVTVSDFYGRREFKFLINGKWFENLETISPYIEKSSLGGKPIRNSFIWAPRPYNDRLIAGIACGLGLQLLEEEREPSSIQIVIANRLPLRFVAGDLLRKTILKKINLALSRAEGYSLSALTTVLEQILESAKSDPDLLKEIGYKLAAESEDLSRIVFLLDYLENNVTPYEPDRKDFPGAPVVHSPGTVEFIFWAKPGTGVYVAGDFTLWQETPLELRPNPEKVCDGNILYSVTVNGLYGPHAYKFMTRHPGRRDVSWCDLIEQITPYHKPESYEIKNGLVWSPRGKGDPFIAGLTDGFIDRMNRRKTDDFALREYIVNNFQIERFPEYIPVLSRAKEIIYKNKTLTETPKTGPPEDTVLSGAILYVSLRAFSAPDKGVSGIEGFVSWYRDNIQSRSSIGERMFTHVIFVPPFEIGEEGRKGPLGSPWSIKSFNVDPNVGTKEELQRGIRILQKEFGLKILFDIPYHSTSIDCPLREEHPDWYREIDPKEVSMWTERWHDILPLDLRKQEVRKYLSHKLREIVEDYEIDGFRFDNVVESSYTPYSTFREIVEDLRSRYPHLFIIAEGREPVLHDFIQMIYGWDILTTLGHILGHERDRKLPDLWKTIRIKTGYEQHGLLLGTLRDQDNTFDKNRAPLTNAALMFGLPGFIPCIWMAQICDGVVIGKTMYPDNVNRQIKEEDWRVKDIREEEFEFFRRLFQIRKEHPALIYGEFTELNPLDIPSPERVMIYERRYGTDSVIVAGDIFGNKGTKIDLFYAGLDKIDLEKEPIDGEYWLGDLITGEGMKLSREQLEDLKARRRHLRIKLPKDRPIYLACMKWDNARHSIFPDERRDVISIVNYQNAVSKILGRHFLQGSPKYYTYLIYFFMMNERQFEGDLMRVIKESKDPTAIALLNELMKININGRTQFLESTNNLLTTFCKGEKGKAVIVTMNLSDEMAFNAYIRPDQLAIREDIYYKISIYDPEKQVWKESFVYGHSLAEDGLEIPILLPNQSRVIVMEPVDTLFPPARPEKLDENPFTASSV